MSMKLIKSKIVLIVLCFPLLTYSAQKDGNYDLEIIDNILYVSYQIEKLLNEKSIEALQRGIKSEVIHKIQLWPHKRFINRPVKQYDPSVKVFYDSWEKKYKIETEDGYRLTSNIETVQKECSSVEFFPLAKVNELETDKEYFVSIQVTFQLISAESYNAISDVFAGEKKKTGEPEEKKGGFVSVLVNLLGFGDKDFSLKTKSFKMTESEEIEFVK